MSDETQTEAVGVFHDAEGLEDLILSNGPGGLIGAHLYGLLAAAAGRPSGDFLREKRD